MKKNVVSVAVIGCGYWGKNLVRNFTQLGALTMVCDSTPAGQALAAEIAPGVEITDRIEGTLSAETDGIVIATPAETHHQLAKQALSAGKDVFVEKLFGEPVTLPIETFYKNGDHSNT